MTIVDTPDFAALIYEAIKAGQENSPRTQQAREGRLGASDIGFCRNKAALVTKGTAPSNPAASWAAAVGTALHEWCGRQIKALYPDWIVPLPEDGDKYRVTATLPRTQAQMSGTFDICVPRYNAILDLKSKNGLLEIRRYGTSLNHRMQRYIYGLGAIDAGLLDPDRPILLGNVYIDRSGQEGMPYAEVEQFDPAFIDEIDAWIEDVIYAVQHGEDASRDIAAARCETFCEFYSVCRGSLPAQDSEPITDPEIINAIDMYVEGRDMAKQGDQMKKEAKALLDGINGSDGRFQVRWVTIPGSEVPGYYREESARLDVRKMKKA